MSDEADDQGQQGCGRREQQPEPLGTTELEGLVAPFGREEVRHADCFLLCRGPVGDVSLRT